ncbi:MAG: (Trans)glycosidase superfamily protein [Mucilaginibacter sp.]|nr:(Trans)glycosidase superfamily protein [Mucilaginibacter sp.]
MRYLNKRIVSPHSPFMHFLVKICVLLNCFLCAAFTVSAQEYTSGPYLFSVSTLLPDAKISFTHNEIKKGLTVVTFVFNAGDSAALPKELTIKWSVPLVGIMGCWTPNGNEPRFIRMSSSTLSNLASQAPVISLFGNNSINRYTFALSDAFHQTILNASVNEGEARMNCSAKLILEKDEKAKNYEVSIFLDSRSVGFYESLKQVSSWWAAMPVYKPSIVPAAAKLPVYSTWYSYHQNFTETDLLNECVRAKAMGYATIIVDDGWQTLNSTRGYAYTGDWKPERIANMADFVKKVHTTGLKFMLWYSVPFVGYHSSSYERFKGKYLYLSDRVSAGVLDPRYPQVRQFIIDKYLHDLKEWDMDGFKLDFIDSFTNRTDDPPAVSKEADFLSLYAAVDQLMGDVKKALTAAKPDILIEFRQTYTGPAMLKYGNMFRAGDCPAGAITNRVRTTDIKLLSGSAAVHSDMLTWGYHEPVHLAALQFLNILFSVPQLSVKLNELPSSHLNMVKFYTNYWLANKDVLLNGDFKAFNPELNYPMLMSTKDNKTIVGLYADMLIPVNNKFADLDIINAKSSENVSLQIAFPMNCRIETFSCEGKLLQKRTLRLKKGIHYLKAPFSGIIMVHQIRSATQTIK